MASPPGNVVYGLIEFRPPEFSLRDQTGNRPSMSRDDQGFTTLNIVEQLRKMRLSLGCLNFPHDSIFQPV